MSAAHARTAALRPGAVLSAESTPRARAIPALRAAAPARPACAFVVRPGALARRQAAPGPLSASASPAPAPRPARDAPGASAPSPRSLVVARAAPAAAPAAPEPKSAASGLAFAFTLVCWFAANAVFAIFNKKTLNVFPYPWLLSWIQVSATRR